MAGNGSNPLQAFRVNIVEQPGWKPWDDGGDIAVRASETAWEEFRNMASEDCADLVRDLAGDLADPEPRHAKYWTPRRRPMTKYDVAPVCDALRKSDRLEETRLAILDALTWMWEEAYSPTDHDIKDAIEAVGERVSQSGYWSLGETLWDPFLEAGGRWDGDAVAEDWAGKVSYERAPGFYDRYLVFDLGAAKSTKQLLGWIRAHPGEAEYDEEGAAREIRAEFAAFKDAFVHEFFRALEREMEDVDPSNRTNWRKHWTSVLRDGDRMRAVREEMSDFVVAAQEEEE